MRKLGLFLGLMLASVLVVAAPALAHWCNNIWTAPSRMVVKPEKSTVYLTGTQSTKLRVYVRNNFPQTLFSLRMRGVATGYTISVSPSSQTAQPGQNVSFLLTITPSGGPTGNVNVSSLNLQVAFRSSAPYGWQDSSDCRVDQTPSLALLRARSVWKASGSSNNCGTNQSASQAAATLADLYPTSTLPSGQPTFGRTGMQQLIHFFGYRFCYSSSGGWRSTGTNCPSPSAEGSAWASIQQFPQNCMRAGVDIAVRKAALGSNLTAARNAAVNAMKGGSGQHKCLAAVVGAYLWQGASSTTAFTSALSSVSTICQNAAKRILSGSPSSSCTGGQYYERAACAAAEGLRNNDGPVTSVLIPNAGDGNSSGDYDSLYYAYMLRIVAGYREATNGTIPFYPDAGLPTADQGVPPDKGLPPDQAPPTPDQAPPTPDKGVPTPDQAPPKPDKAVPTPDQGVPDKAVPAPDKSVPKPDGPAADGPVVKPDGPATDGPVTDGPVTKSDGPVTKADKGAAGDSGKRRTLSGGCVLASASTATERSWIVLALAQLVLWRRRRRSH